MERITFEGNFCDIAMCRESPCPYNGMCSQRETWERLKKYEDTGLEPEQVMELKSFTQGGIHKVDDGWKHVQDLLQAEKEGRMVLLPCKVGDTVWVIWGKDVIYYIVDRIHILANNQVQIRAKHHVIDNVYLYPDMFGKTVFLTREEAEAALAQEGGTHEADSV